MDVQTAMTQITQRLESALQAAQVNNANATSIWGTNGQEAAASNLVSDRGYLNSLESFQMQDVLSGDWTFDKWKAQANTIFSDILTQDSTVAMFSFSDILINTASATGTQIADGAKVVAAVGLPLLTIALVAVVCIYIVR